MVVTTSTNKDTPTNSLHGHESTRIGVARQSHWTPIHCLAPIASDVNKENSCGSYSNSNHDQVPSFDHVCLRTICPEKSCKRTTDSRPRSNTKPFNRNVSSTNCSTLASSHFNASASFCSITPSQQLQQNKQKLLRKNPKLKVIVKNKVMTPFPILVYHFVCSGHPNYVQWTHHGSQFTLFTHNTRKLSSLLCTHMLPKLSSFIRKLYFYGWKQLPNTGNFQRTFHHPSFHKCANLCDIANHVTNQSKGGQSEGQSSSTLPSYKNGKARNLISPSPRPMRTCSKKTTANNTSGSVVVGGAHYDLETTKVTMSPISISHAPSRCYDVLFSPMNTSFRFFHEDDRNHDHDNHQAGNEDDNELRFLVCDESVPSSGINSIRIGSPFWSGQKQSFVEVSNDDTTSNIHDNDDVSELSVPISPLSMDGDNSYGPLGRFNGNEK